MGGYWAQFGGESGNSKPIFIQPCLTFPIQHVLLTREYDELAIWTLGFGLKATWCLRSGGIWWTTLMMLRTIAWRKIITNIGGPRIRTQVPRGFDIVRLPTHPLCLFVINISDNYYMQKVSNILENKKNALNI